MFNWTDQIVRSQTRPRVLGGLFVLALLGVGALWLCADSDQGRQGTAELDCMTEIEPETSEVPMEHSGIRPLYFPDRDVGSNLGPANAPNSPPRKFGTSVTTEPNVRTHESEPVTSYPETDAIDPEMASVHPETDAIDPEMDSVYPETDAIDPEMDSVHPETDAIDPKMDLPVSDPKMDLPTIDPKMDLPTIDPKIDLPVSDPKTDSVYPETDATMPKMLSFPPKTLAPIPAVGSARIEPKVGSAMMPEPATNRPYSSTESARPSLVTPKVADSSNSRMTIALILAEEEDSAGPPDPPKQTEATQPDQGKQPTAKKQESEESKKIGVKPPESANRLLTRDVASSLLDAGKIQAEVDVGYAWTHADAVTVLPTDSVALERIRQRKLIVPFSLHYGLTDKVELFGTIPFTASFYERDNPLVNLSDEAGVLGDISFGLSTQCFSKQKDFPSTTLTVSAVAPTGLSPLRVSTGNIASTGSGFWQTSVMMNMMKSYDPIVVFGGLGSRFAVPRSHHDIWISPGASFVYYFGVGFSASDTISFSTNISGSWTGATKINGQSSPNSDTESIALRLSMLRRISKKNRVQPYVQFGLTDSESVMFGIRYVHDH